jgi:hypothetical protein
MKLANSLFGRVVIALLLGIGIGMAAPDFGRSLQPLGDGFVKLNSDDHRSATRTDTDTSEGSPT